MKNQSKTRGSSSAGTVAKKGPTGVPIYLLVGVPCSGKTWVVNQVLEQFEPVRNDDHIGGDYIGAILKASDRETGKPVLAEAPFSVAQVVDPLKARGRRVIPVFILEREGKLIARYFERTGEQIPQGHLTRQETYRIRAETMKAFSGTSAEVLSHLRKEVAQ